MLSFFQKKWREAQNWLKGTAFKSFPSLSREKDLAHPICQMICIDDDKSFCIFMQQLAHSIGIQMDVAHAIQEGKELIEANPEYKSFIIDGHLPDGSGFELVAWIREKKGIALPIVFISRIYQDATSFRLLRESLKVNFVLEKPIRPAEVQQLFAQLCHSMSLQPAMQEPFSDELLLDLKISYQKTISDKVERLEKMILDVQKKSSIENFQILKGEVHKIAGSAGSYGFLAVSDLCKNLELELAKQIDLTKQNQFNAAWLASLDDFFTQIKLHFQMKIPEFEFQSSLRTGFLPTIYVVDEDEEFLKDFTQSIRELDFEILTEKNPDQAIQKMLAADFYPEILFFNAHYHSSSLMGYDLIQAFYQNNDELTNVIALMVEEQDLGSQVEALQKGMPLVVAKPFLPSLFLPLLESTPFRALPLPFKVFIIDDDLDICQYVLKTLKFTGLEVRALQDISDLENTIKKESPDLILLDINLTDQDGVGILHRLRHDWGYQDLLVGMLALTQQESHLLQQCYEANINDLLFKPLERGVLQRKVSLLLKKKAEEKLSAKQDEKMKWASVQTFKRYLNELEQHLQPFYLKMLVIFEVGGLSTANSKIKKKVVEMISQSFEDLLKKYEIATHLGHERFALIFQGYDPHFVQLLMRHFLQSVQTYLQSHLLVEPFPIYEALVLLSQGTSDVHILHRSGELLELAKKMAKESISMITDPSFVALKEVFIFHDETQPLDFLETLFKEQGFKVRMSVNCEELPQASQALPLFILAGSFAEAKGVHLLKKLISQNQIQISILHLPFLPDQDYIHRLLRGVDYFQSPFSLVILLAQKPS